MATSRTFRATLLAASAVVTLCSAAHAATTSTTLAASGSWVATQVSHDDGTTGCTMQTYLHSQLVVALTAVQGEQKFRLIVAYGNWSTPREFKTRFDFAFDGGGRWGSEEDNGFVSESHVTTTIAEQSAREFVHSFTGSAYMQIWIQNSQPLSVELVGTTAVWGAFMDCAKRVAPAVVASLAPPQAAPSLFGTAAFAPSAPPIASPGIVGEAPITWNAGGYDVTAQVNGRSLTFTLDTGATTVVIPQNVADQLMIDGTLTTADYLGPSTATLADGSKQTINRYKLRSITVGGRTVHDVVCDVGDNGMSLLLGQSFLLHFKTWSTDNQRKVLLLGEPA